METAGDIIKDALFECTVLGAEAPIEPSEAQSSIRYLNRMMAALDADGVPLGYTEVSDFADNVTINAGANAGVVAMLAVALWNQFSNGDPVPSSLMARADVGYKTLLNIAVTIGAAEYPDTLPKGSGNTGNSVLDTHFYADLEDTILAETGGNIGLEAST